MESFKINGRMSIKERDEYLYFVVYLNAILKINYGNRLNCRSGNQKEKKRKEMSQGIGRKKVRKKYNPIIL